MNVPVIQSVGPGLGMLGLYGLQVRAPLRIRLPARAGVGYRGRLAHRLCGKQTEHDLADRMIAADGQPDGSNRSFGEEFPCWPVL